MLKRLTVVIGCLCLMTGTVLGGTYTEQEGREAWAQYRAKAITESNFRAVCDLLQDIGKNNINLSYEILAEYVPMVRKTGNRDHLHILLMGWAKAKESLIYFEDAEVLYRQARENAVGNARHTNEALVGTVLLYSEWGRPDSVKKYADLGKEAAERSGDKESLSFIYTFGYTSLRGDTALTGRSLTKAIGLAEGLSDKNALFTAKYNYAVYYCSYSPQRQVQELDALLPLTKDPSLSHKPRLYERTAFCFRNPASNIYMQLMQVNLMLADYDNAWKFGELLYDAVVKPNPAAAQAAYFNTELAMVKAYQQDFPAARVYLAQSLRLFKVDVEKIPYPSYFLAAGMVAESEKRMEDALHYYEKAYKMGPMEGLHLMPSELYYSHALILTHRLDDAQRVLTTLQGDLPARMYTSFGFYYYKHYAELLKARGDYPGYARALETYYTIRDSLASFSKYRTIREIEEKVRLRDKEQQILRLNEESAERLRNTRRERVYFSVSLALALLAAFLLVAYARIQYLRRKQEGQIARQNEAIQDNRMRAMEKQYRIDILQGAIEAEESERRKVADQLHDEVGGMLSLALLNLSSSLEKEGETAAANERLKKVQEILVSVSTTIRELSHRLTPLVIEKYGFRKAVEDMVYAANLSGKLQVGLIITGFEHMEKYPVSFLNDCYRMLQELLHNIFKHARARHASLELTEHDDGISIMVEDDGIGIEEGPAVKGKGLGTIRSKIAYLNGRVEISRKKEGGTGVVIELPFDPGAAQDSKSV